MEGCHGVAVVFARARCGRRRPVRPTPRLRPAVWDKNAAALRAAATPEQRDIVCLDSMVPHHCAAVPMSRSEVERGTYQPATELAETIGKNQRMEVMKRR